MTLVSVCETFLDKDNKNSGVNNNFGIKLGAVAGAGAITFILTHLLLLFLGKFLWNNYLVNVTTIVKPLTSIFQLLAVSVLLKLLF